ncbi:hypothetical protein KFE25_004703 [Diacronema lutheri]|uniref:HhH-GPD domain-containing protein n=1 Tax=Diacronema lutheri TaxID=2081491 RepID=A0A8J6C5L1_DIALT|nr:hypothetical protein KFE25_004703 [Diacronema lutheri]
MAATISAAIAHLRAADARLAALLDASPCGFDRLAAPARGSAFTQLARTIVSQQLGVAAAGAIFARVRAAVGASAAIAVATVAAAAAADDEEDISPAVLLATPEPALLAAGLSRAKLRALRDLAARFSDGRLSEALVASAHDDAALAAALTAVVGVGAWTVDMFLIFALKRPDVLPTGDLAVRKGMLALYGCRARGGGGGGGGGARAARELPSAAAMIEIAESWRPYRTFGAYLMWHAQGTSQKSTLAAAAAAAAAGAAAPATPVRPSRAEDAARAAPIKFSPRARPMAVALARANVAHTPADNDGAQTDASARRPARARARGVAAPAGPCGDGDADGGRGAHAPGTRGVKRRLLEPVGRPA